MGFLAQALAYLTAIAVGWIIPLLGVAILLPLIQLVFLLQPFVAAGIQLVLGGLLVWYSLNREAIWQAIVWGVLWGLGVLTALLGVFHWYTLVIEAVLLVVLAIPGVMVSGWLNIIRWFAVGEITFTLILLYQREAGVSVVAVVTAILLVVLAALIGSGALRPFEVRRLRRRVATFAILAAVALLIWQPVILPVAGFGRDALKSAASAVASVVSTSPIGRWYNVWALRSERRELAERAKTEALRQLEDQLRLSHRQRWEKAVEEIPNLPLAPGEWGNLGVPREADP